MGLERRCWGLTLYCVQARSQGQQAHKQVYSPGPQSRHCRHLSPECPPGVLLGKRVSWDADPGSGVGSEVQGQRDWKSQVEIAKIEKNFGPEESNAVPSSCTQLQYDPETEAGTEGDAVRSRRPSERLPEEEIDPEFRTRRFMGRTVARGEAERKPRERPGAAAGSRGAQDSTLRLCTLLGVWTSSFCSLRLRARNAGTSSSSRPFQKRIGLCGFLCSLRPSHKVK